MSRRRRLRLATTAEAVGWFWWWDDAMALANRKARETGRRHRVTLTPPDPSYGRVWLVVESWPL